MVFPHQEKEERLVLKSLGNSFIRKWFCISSKERIKSCDHFHFSTCFMTTKFSIPLLFGGCLSQSKAIVWNGILLSGCSEMSSLLCPVRYCLAKGIWASCKLKSRKLNKRRLSLFCNWFVSGICHSDGNVSSAVESLCLRTVQALSWTALGGWHAWAWQIHLSPPVVPAEYSSR